MKMMPILSGLLLSVMLIIPAGASVSAPVDMAQRTEELQQLRFGMFICWSFSTFSGYEWSPGVDDIRFFNPTGFDPDQWCRVASDAGMGYVLFLTKHHDGFCLWDTKTTDRKVTNSPLGIDALAEVKKSCEKHGLKLALYFSEGDWSWSGRKDIHQSIARPEIKKAQLQELLTRYGPIEYIWFDHAVGTGGLSHGETAALVKSLQPGCFVGFNHGDQTGTDIRIGERGKPAPLENTSADAIGSENRASFMQGHQGYRLAEFTYPILEGQGRAKLRGAQWFYSLPENDEQAVSAEKIYLDYLGAVRYGNIFSLDIGPDRNGRIRAIDVERLRKVGRYIRGEAALPPLPLAIRSIKASSTWSSEYGPDKAIDGNRQTRWGAAEGARSGQLELELEQEQTIARILIDEGNWGRIEQYVIQASVDNGWQTIYQGTTIGNSCEITLDKPVSTDRLRIDFLKANEVPTICEVEVYETK